MAGQTDPVTRDDLLIRRAKLEQSLASLPEDQQFRHLLQEVDAALNRMDKGTYGLCQTCKEPVEAERLIADPLIRFCIDHLPPAQRDALSEDLALAAQIQAGLLPPKGLHVGKWETAYHYEAASVVSGDYCDLLSYGGYLYFMVGDVSGKGVSAALLMAHLHATFRALAFQGLPLEQIMERANRLFCESSLSTHFATLACGRADEGGNIEFSNAGHDPALVIRGPQVERIGATGLPLGMFCNERFSVTAMRLHPGDCLLLYTDGFTESTNPSGEQYGIERLVHSFEATRGTTPQDAVASCLADLDSFRMNIQSRDDLTVLAIRRVAISP